MLDEHVMRLSLHMMVLNGAGVVERALRPLGGIADEVVFVDTGSTDGTPEIIAEVAAGLGMACTAILMSPDTHPRDYFLDDPSSFRGRYAPISAERAFFFDDDDGLSWIPRDWSLCRNRALDACSGKYVLKLDADDEVMTPENVLPTLAYLDVRPDIDIVMCPYEVMTRPRGSQCDAQAVEHTSMYTRLWRRSTRIRFAEVCHENVDHARDPSGSNWLMVPSGLVVRDWRDSRGAGVRPAHRNLKVLLLEYERLIFLGSKTLGSKTLGSKTLGSKTLDLRPRKHLLMYLADEAATVLPDLSIEALEQVQDLTPADEVWDHVIRGQALERLGEPRAAASEYEAAQNLGSPRAALLLGMVEHGLGRPGWDQKISAAIPRCRQKMWPFGASNPEIASAQELLGEARVAGVP